MKIIYENLKKIDILIFESYLNQTFCEVYYCNGKSQLKNKDGSWLNLIINVSDLKCCDNFSFNDDGMADKNSINIFIEEIVEIITNNSIPNNCNTLQIHIGDKTSDGDWDEFYISCEFEL